MFKLGILIPSLKYASWVTDHTCIEKIGDNSIYFCDHPSRARNRYDKTHIIIVLCRTEQSSFKTEQSLLPHLQNRSFHSILFRYVLLRNLIFRIQHFFVEKKSNKMCENLVSICYKSKCFIFWLLFTLRILFFSY